ncbi:MAG: hypothetical protein Q9214_004905 [Letrouitia sp. 1 TL-2023]
MAPESSTSAGRRPRHAFKPPLPASKSKMSDAASRRKSAPARGPSFSPTTSEGDLNSATKDSSSSDEVGQSDTAGPPLSTQDPPPTIPPKLLTRLLHYHPEKSGKGGLRIEKEANALVGKYMETFILEAIARAAYERSQADGESGAGDGFLEVRSPAIQIGGFTLLTLLLYALIGGRFGKISASAITRFLISLQCQQHITHPDTTATRKKGLKYVVSDVATAEWWPQTSAAVGLAVAADPSIANLESPAKPEDLSL